jgi:hypothetical protein
MNMSTSLHLNEKSTMRSGFHFAFRALFVFFVTVGFARAPMAADSEVEAWYTPRDKSWADETSCQYQGEDFLKNKRIDESCYSLAFKKASLQNRAISSAGDIYAVAYRNIIYVAAKTKDGFDLRMISGEMPSLHNIKAIALHPGGHEIAVLDESEVSGKPLREIKLFPTKRNGSVAPSRIMKSDFVSLAVDIKFHPTQEEIYILTQNPSAVYVLSKDADSRSLEPKKKVKPRRTLVGAKTLLGQPSHLLLAGNEIIVMDLSQNKLLRYPLDAEGDISPSKTVALPEKAHEITWLPNTKEIRVLDSSGLVLKTWMGQKPAKITEDQTQSKSLDK